MNDQTVQNQPVNPIEEEFRRWSECVYGQTLQGDQAAQIEMAFFAGVIACSVVMRRVGGLDMQTAPPQYQAAIGEISQGVMAHLARCMKSADVIRR